MNRIGMQPEDKFMVAIARTLVVITSAGNVFGADIVNNELQPVFQFGGAKIGFNPEDRFAVAIDSTILIITQNGSVFGSEVTGRELGPVFRYDGATIGFNPEDLFMVSIGHLLVVINKHGSVFGGIASGKTIGPITQIASGKIGFNPQDKFMVAMDNTLAVITSSGDVFGANVRQSLSSTGITVDGQPTGFLHELDPVTQFSGAKIGFNQQDRFMVAMGQRLAVITDDGNVFGSDVRDGRLGDVFQISDSPPPPLEHFDVNRPDIKFGPGLPIGGHARFTIYSDGITHFQGHIHTSGLPSFDCLVVLTVKDSDNNAYPATIGGRVHGTDEPGSRDMDWDVWGTSDAIRENWPKIRNGGQPGSRVDVTSDFSAVKIAEEIGLAVGVVLGIIPLVMAAGGPSNKAADPRYVLPEP